MPVVKNLYKADKTEHMYSLLISYEELLQSYEELT